MPRVRRRIPWDLWQDKDVKAALAVALPVELQPILSLYDRDARTLSPVTLPIYDALESNSTDPLFVDFHGSGEGLAAWGFAGRSLDGILLFDRWGYVVVDQDDPLFLGAETASNNTTELTGFGESLAFLFSECTYDWRTKGLVFCFDSTYAIGEGTGAFRIQTNHELVKTIRSIWTAAFDVDSGLIFGQKIKSHTGNPFNDYVDGLADLGSAGSHCPG